MALADQATLAIDARYRERVKVAMFKAAVAVSSEAVGGTLGLVRKRCAHSITRAPDEYLDAFAWAVVADDAIDASTTDRDLESRVAAVFNLIAGVGTRR